jgi:hypothetical protein
VFDIPHPTKPARTEAANSARRLTSMSSGGTPTGEEPSQKWGILGKIPLLPRVFSDIYSFASTRFEIGDEPFHPTLDNVIPRPQKGVIGWTSDHSLIVIGAGRDSRWEKFIIAEGEDGKRYCVRDGWKRYLGAT